MRHASSASSLMFLSSDAANSSSASRLRIAIASERRDARLSRTLRRDSFTSGVPAPESSYAELDGGAATSAIRSRNQPTSVAVKSARNSL